MFHAFEVDFPWAQMSIKKQVGSKLVNLDIFRFRYIFFLLVEEFNFQV